MTDRRHALRLLSGTALSTAFAAPLLATQAFANDRDRDRERRDSREAPENALLYELQLKARARLLVVTQIYVLAATQLFWMNTRAGVEQFNENRLSLSAIPILGTLARKRFQEDEFTPSNEIGAVYAEGTALFIYLFPEVMLDPVARTLLFLNLSYSFVLRGQLEPSQWFAMAAMMPTFCAIGAVGRAVQSRLALGRPSIARIGDTAPDMDHLALAGKLNDDTQGQSKIPAIKDIPLLKDMFVGPIHQAADGKLITVVRPSIVFGDRET